MGAKKGGRKEGMGFIQNSWLCSSMVQEQELDKMRSRLLAYSLSQFELSANLVCSEW